MRAQYLGLIVAFVAQVAVAAAPEVDQLRAELEAMKAERARQDQQMRALEARIQALETASSATPPAQPAPALAAADQIRAQVAGEFQGDTESREQAMLTTVYTKMRPIATSRSSEMFILFSVVEQNGRGL